MRAAERAAFLTRQMLAYAGKGRLVQARIDMAELIREIATLIRASISKTVSLYLDVHAGLPAIEGDPGQIQQLVMNLVINGAEAIGEERPGSVEIRTALRQLSTDDLLDEFPSEQLAAGTYVAVSISDNGAGMDEATLGRIFDPFFTTKFTGRGLGLAAVLGIVRSHKGAIRVWSQPGEGSSFEIVLPAAGQSERAESKQPTRFQARGETVLVVDDEEIVRQVATAVLENAGFRVLTAENGRAGVALFEAHRDSIDVVFLDLLMPEMGGEEAFEAILSIRPDVPIILSSGFDRSEAERRFAGRRLAGFIQKPYNVDRLLGAIRAVLPGYSRPK
jgi:CheY-like chemotaxis protein